MSTETLQTRPRVRFACEEITSLAKDAGANAQLPTMVQLRESIGVSMNTLHAALRELESQQVVRSIHGVGIFVAEPKKSALTGNIGIIGSAGFNTQQTPFFVQIERGIQNAAQRSKRRLMYLGTDRNWDANGLELVDGLILTGHRDEVNQEIKSAAPAGMPCVSMFTHSPGMNCVTTDDYEGARLAVGHLVQMGHTRIACLMQKDPYIFEGRFSGYCDALLAAGIIAAPSWMWLPKPTSRPRLQSFQEWGSGQMQSWLKDGWGETGCTAILAQNDLTAIGVLQVLQENGVEVPGQVSVVGFDGTDLCDYTSPQLAAVQLPLDELGRKAVELLDAQISNGTSESQTVMLPANWRDGGSVAPLLNY